MVLAIDSTALLSPLPPKLTAPLSPPPLWPPPLPPSFAATWVKSEGSSKTLAGACGFEPSFPRSPCLSRVRSLMASTRPYWAGRMTIMCGGF